MDSLSYKTKHLNKATVEPNWVIIDANDQVLGRLASRIAYVLRGKHKPGYTPHVDCGDRVVVINAEKVRLTGSKALDRPKIWHTGYPSGQRTRTPKEYVERVMAYKIIENAVKGMLPRTRLGRKQYTNLYVYNGTEHKHEAQQPQPLELNF